MQLGMNMPLMSMSRLGGGRYRPQRFPATEPGGKRGLKGFEAQRCVMIEELVPKRLAALALKLEKKYRQRKRNRWGTD